MNKARVREETCISRDDGGEQLVVGNQTRMHIQVGWCGAGGEEGWGKGEGGVEVRMGAG